jgi:hypothetical protein
MNFANTSKGPVLRTRARRIPQNSFRQQRAQAKWQRATLMWQALTDTQRNQWRTLAATINWPNALGTPRKISGFSLYHQMAIPRMEPVGTAMTAEPPLPTVATSRIVAAPFMSVSGASDIRLNLTRPPGVSIWLFGLWVSTPRSTIKPANQRHGQLVQWTNTSTTAFTVNVAIRQVLGTVFTGQQLQFRFVGIEPGKLPSPPYTWTWAYTGT